MIQPAGYRNRCRKVVSNTNIFLVIICSLLLILSKSNTDINVYRHLDELVVDQAASSTTTTTQESSYIQICKAIASSNGKKIVIKEDPKVCKSKDVHDSLMTIFASYFLVSRLDNKNISYESCSSSSSDSDNISTVQQHLSHPVVFPTSAKARPVNELCSECSNNPECILFPNMEDINEKHMILSAIHSSLIDIEVIKTAVKLPLASEKEELAVLTIEGNECFDFSKYFHIYSLEIPRSVTRINIVVSEEFVNACSKKCEMNTMAKHLGKKFCFYDQTLKAFLSHYFKKPVTLYKTLSSIQKFHMYMNSKYLICHSTDQCFFPALLSGNFVSMFGEKPSKLSSLFQGWRNILFIDSELYMNDNRCHRLLGRNGVWKQGWFLFMLFYFFLITQCVLTNLIKNYTKSNYEKVTDSAKIASFQYNFTEETYPGLSQYHFKPSDEMPYRPSTTYEWNENNFKRCLFELVSKDNFCKALAKKQLKRVLFVGDSSQRFMTQSLTKLLGMEDIIVDYNYHGTLSCPNYGEVEISYIRNDQLIENNLPIHISSTDNKEERKMNCDEFCYPWTEEYKNSPHKTLLIINTGAHYKAFHKFQRAVESTLEFLDKVNNRKDDIIMFRTTAPGHENCEKYAQQPFSDYYEYIKNRQLPSEFNANWNLFPSFNAYIAKLIDNRRRRLNSSHSTSTIKKIQLLGISSMTVLRPDGHPSGGECYHEACKKNIDCLHYSLPGVIDWWNHLMINHLKHV